MDRPDRRRFLRNAAYASGWFVTRGMAEVAPPSPSPVSGAPAPIARAPIALVVAPASTDASPRARSWAYIAEILRRAGIFFEEVDPGRIPEMTRRDPPLVLLAGQVQLTAEQRALLTTWVQRGGAVIAIGSTAGLDDVFGVTGAPPLSEGWIKVTCKSHPVTAALRSPLHVFGGCTASTGPAVKLAEIEGNGRVPKGGGAILEHRFGNGVALLFGPDLIFSILHIQQGLRVLQDGTPATDGTAAVDDGVLKAEDGSVLHWERDRQPMRPDDKRAFLEPISDELRELILRGIFHVCRQRNIALPVLWYWPRQLKAVGLISHDSDHNDPAKAAALLEVMNRCGIKSTWSILYPGGYPPEFYGALKDQGFEIGLHYDALTGKANASWSKEAFRFQHSWLLKEAGLQGIASNKNHYTRWEGRLDYLRWCEELGVVSDQTRGPSKLGTIGFPLGGSQPYFPLDDEIATPRFLNVLEINLLTQDLVVVCPAEYGPQLLHSAANRNGVAHFLFHPNHILKPGVANALEDTVDRGRRLGLEWWTGRQIHGWEMLRRSVTAKFDSGRSITLHAPNAVNQATLLILASGAEARSVEINGRPMKVSRHGMHGFEFDSVTLDLSGDHAVVCRS